MRASWTRLAVLGALLLGCDDPAPTQVEPPDPLDPTVRPHVVSTYPPDGGSGPFELYVRYGPLRPHFILRFDKLIRAYAFEPRWLRMAGFESPVTFRLLQSPELTDALSVAVHDSATHAPNLYVIGRTYTVTVDTTLRDATGNQPEAPHRFSFVPEPHFRVVDVDFERGQPVGSTARVRLLWNGTPAASIGSSIRFEPSVAGSWSGSEGHLTFFHEQPFAYRTTYALHVDQAAMDTQGHRMSVPYTTTFDVRPFEILGATPEEGTSWTWPAYRYISVEFTGIIDTTSVPGAFAIEPSIPGRFRLWPSVHFEFEPVEDFQPSTLYRVAISTALRASDGTALAAPYAFSFTTSPFLVVTSHPYHGEIDVALGTTIEVKFDMQLDPSTIEPAFTIVPALSGAFAVLDSTVAEFHPDAPLAPATLYEVTISTALRAANGAVFPAPYTFSFTTR